VTAILTARRAAAGVTTAELLDGADPGEIVEAMAVVAGALLRVAAPGERGDRLLQDLGQLAAAPSGPWTEAL
jgi:hypothetical protein